MDAANSLFHTTTSIAILAWVQRPWGAKPLQSTIFRSGASVPVSKEAKIVFMHFEDNYNLKYFIIPSHFYPFLHSSIGPSIAIIQSTNLAIAHLGIFNFSILLLQCLLPLSFLFRLLFTFKFICTSNFLYHDVLFIA